MTRCAVCHFPVVAGGEAPHVCQQCAMIAEGRTYRDGSSPAEGLSRGEIVYIGTRVASIRHAKDARPSHVETSSLDDWDRIIERNRSK